MTTTNRPSTRTATRLSLATTAALALVGTAASSASAASPWTAYRTSEVTVASARSTCAFDVRITPLEDEEEYRTTSTWPDGSPRTQVFRGTLVERYTNLSTGASVVRDLSATAVFAYRADGSPESLTSVHGAFGATMPTGSTPDTGLYVIGGHGSRVDFLPDGTRSFTLGPNGTAEDVCDALD